ncbi:MAG: amidohydrolase family protein, partial [Planctomycetota bacterium]
TLLPGLIDAHVHLGSTLEGDFVNRAVHEGPADTALRAAHDARVTLLAGFTTVRNVGSEGFVDVALKRAIERGDIPGPWIVPAGHSLSPTGGHGDATGFRPGILEGGPREGIADGPEEVRKAVRMQIKYGAEVIKCVATAGVLSFEKTVGAEQYSFEELKAMVDEARLHGVKVAAHAHGPEGILAAIRAGVASIEHGSILTDEALRLMKEKGTYLVPTTYLADAIDLDNLPPHLRKKAEEILPQAKESLRKAVRAGVKIAFGTDAAVIPHGQNAREFAAMVERGMSPLEAIRSATLRGADLLDLPDRGVLAPGKRADVIAVPGNPLENVRLLEDVRFVMKGGMVFRREDS